MQRPFLRNNSQLVSLPQLTGGINLRDNVSDIPDNQMTNELNMWYKDGILQTRPAIEYDDDSARALGRFSSSTFYGQEVHSEITYNGKVLCSCFESDGDSYSTIRFYWIDEYVDPVVPEELSTIQAISVSEAYVTYFVIEKDGYLYCFVSNGSVYKCNYNAATPGWSIIQDDDFYIPTIMTNCLPLNSSSSQKIFAASDGVMIDGYNLLSKYAKIVYSTVNPNIYDVTQTSETHRMYYAITMNIKKIPGETITLKYTAANGQSYTHTVTIDSQGGESIESSKKGDDLWLRASGKTLCLGTVSNNVFTPKSWTLSEYIEDNCEITFPAFTTAEASSNKRKITSMTQSSWFGGAAAGISGGNRLFLCGSTQTKNKHLVCWSGLNNPLFFPENAYFYVGNGTQRAVTFGKQDDKLIIFKENETYYTYYQQNNSITADDLINQSIVDYTANAVYFPLITLNSSIGCDLPNSVQLCRNRLVWAHSSGKVYTLVTFDNNNERSIFDISGMIKRNLPYGFESGVCSADWEGHYLLKCGEYVYLLDYNSYGFQYIYSYSKTEDAQLKAPWYIWKLPYEIERNEIELGKIGCANSKLFIVAVHASEIYSYSEAAIISYRFGNNNFDSVYYEYNHDEEAEIKYKAKQYLIHSICQTKVFDFGLPYYSKNIYEILLSLGENGGVPISVSYLTESSELSADDIIIPYSYGVENYSSKFIQSVRIVPYLRGNKRIGIRLECDGRMYIDRMQIKYQVIGGVR